MAYYVNIEKICQAGGCGRRATHELFDDNGRSRGLFCEADARHEKQRLDAGSKSGRRP